MAEDGWVPVRPRTLETKYPGVYAVGHGANTATPKAGVFAEGAAKALAEALVAKITSKGGASLYSGAGTCYIEFGGGQIGKVEVDFFSGPKPTGTYWEPSVERRSEKVQFGSSRRAKWFGETSELHGGSRRVMNSVASTAFHVTDAVTDTSTPTTSAIAKSGRRRWSIAVAFVAFISFATLAAGVASIRQLMNYLNLSAAQPR